MSQPFLTPVGRLVSGDLFKGQDRDNEGNLYKDAAGGPQLRYSFGLAFAKTDAGWPAFYAIILAEAKTGFPSLFPNGGDCIQPAFAFKVTDGDSVVPNSKGTTPASREGYAGHWVVWFSGTFSPKVFSADNPPQPIAESSLAKKGYYYRVSGSVKANGSQQRPGVYMNYDLVQLCGVGEVIQSGPDAGAAFAAPIAALPAGASAAPVVAAHPLAAPIPAVGNAPATAAPPSPAASIASHSSGVQPAPGFLEPPAVVAPPLPVVEQSYHYNGAVVKESQLVGWTPEQIATLQKA